MERDEIKSKLKHGQKPVFKKKCKFCAIYAKPFAIITFVVAERKVEELVDKYEDLKKHNKVQKYIEKRAKKIKKADANKFNT